MTGQANANRERRQHLLPAVAVAFVTSLVVSNIIAVKLFQAGSFVLPAAIIIFPLSYIFGDILTEVYGYARARQIIWTGFGCNLLAVAAIWTSIRLQPAAFWTLGGLGSAELSQQAYAAVFGTTPRILLASFTAYLFGEFLNAFVLAKLKIATRGRHLWMRTIGSTLVGQLADSAIFVSLAFSGTIPPAALGTLIVTQWVIKSAYEALATPLTYLAVFYLKRAENEDYYDIGTNFNPLSWKR
ncbi:MAG: queuosine precursor transporter [Proteobacteria bacterium]|nr:queuosine precursor transporter [Pseudomonadota bacterium]